MLGVYVGRLIINKQWLIISYDWMYNHFFISILFWFVYTYRQQFFLSLYFEGHYVWRYTAVIHVAVCNLGIFYSLSVLFGTEISFKNPLEYEEGRWDIYLVHKWKIKWRSSLIYKIRITNLKISQINRVSDHYNWMKRFKMSKQLHCL